MNFDIIPKAEASVESFINTINKVVINPIIYFLFSLGTILFLFGIVRFFLKTPELNRYESEEGPFAEFPKGILLIKYGPQMEVLSSISARYAKQFVREKRWEARNDVVAINSTGDTLKTEHLIWDEPGKRIYNNEFVQIIRTDQIITGVGFESDASLENWRIKNPKGTIYVQLNREGVAPGDSLGSGDSLRPVNFGNE